MPKQMASTRAEGPTSLVSFEGLEYSHLQALQLDGTDGAWYCCQCPHENHLVHWKGPHPFEMLKCASCKHVACRACQTTDILAVLDKGTNDELLAISCKSDNVRYGSICPLCGLSHRARTEPKEARRLLNILKSRGPTGEAPPGTTPLIF
jgi:hypothetical protein